LNLRRYLRQRRLKMPAAMTVTWLSTGAVLIVGLTALAGALPFSGTGWRALRAATGEGTDLRASRHAILKDSGVQGEGARSDGAAAKAAKHNADRRKTDGEGDTNDSNAQQQTSGEGRGGGDQGPGRAKSGVPRGKPTRSAAGKAGSKGSAKDQASDEGKNQDRRADNQGDREKDTAQDAKRDGSGEAKQDSESSEKSGEQSRETPSRAPQLPSLPMITASPLIKALLIGAAVVALGFGLWRHGLMILWALRDLLASLFGGFFLPDREKRTKDPAPAPAAAPPPRPFASFINPFANGLANKLSPDDLVLYSYEALEAWASDHNQSRLLNETPLEFLQRLGAIQVDLHQYAAPVVGYYVAIVYGQRGAKPDILPVLQQFWTTIQGIA
jgi:hypothetical protein